MKSNTVSLFLIIFITIGQVVNAQSYSDKVKKREIKAGREASKQAKEYQKDGWQVPQGSLPMEKLLEKSWNKQLAEDENGNPEFVWADAIAVAGTHSAADLAALEKAKLNLVGQLESKIKAIVQISLETEQNSSIDADTKDKVVANSKNVMTTNLQQVEPTYKVYRTLENNNVEVRLILFYSYKTLKEQVEASTKQVLGK